jgi:DNA invertase Pin-like site-specific DNA recombinase
MTPKQRIAKIDRQIQILEASLAEKKAERKEVVKLLLAEAEESLKELRREYVRPYAGKKRGVPKGTPNKKHRKFSDAQVREMRKKFANGTSQEELSKEYGSPQPVISRIVNRLNYSDVD